MIEKVHDAQCKLCGGILTVAVTNDRRVIVGCKTCQWGEYIDEFALLVELGRITYGDGAPDPRNN